MAKRQIFVTQPSLASLADFSQQLESVWASGVLTHNGPLVRKLEEEICQTINSRNFLLCTNGTIALQMAIKALGLKGEIITTPFSWIATVSAIKWEGCVPVFCDIDPHTLNIDVEKLESHITKNTVGIMPVHVFGNPCHIERIDKIAKTYNLKVIYDAAHAVGTNYKQESVLNFGDISATSLHATKIYNTAEGGGLTTANLEMLEKLKRIRFFGHDQNKQVVEDGLNAKMTEIHAALGLVNLKHFSEVLDDRKRKYRYYKTHLSALTGLAFQAIDEANVNFSYFPIILDSEKKAINVLGALEAKGYYARRYFYPSLNTLSEIVEYAPMPISEDISQRILCLPLYWKLGFTEIDEICAIIATALRDAT